MKQSILIIDDDEPILGLLSEFFEERGYETATAGTCMAGLRLADEYSPDLVILDLSLADGDGFDLLENLHDSQPDLPVVILTGMGYDDGLLQEALEIGAVGYLSKNLPIEQLLMEVHRHLNKKPIITINTEEVL